LWVLNTHFLLDEASKERSAANLGQMIAHDAAFAGSAIVLAGDFNFFPDLDGPKQRSLLLEASGMRDLGASGALLSTNGQRVDGTFVGYGHDNMKAPDGQVGSRLDHIFVKKIESESDLVLIDKTMRDIEPPTLSTRDYPSDHFPIKVAFAL
jgi:endonuclease/exonuclease/phosphatase family metal-dependent hydrolase